MKKKQIIGMIVAAFLFILIGISHVLVKNFSESTFMKDTMAALTAGTTDTTELPDEAFIAVVKVEGTIQQQVDGTSLFDEGSSYLHNSTMDYIDELIANDENKGMILYVDSPGGAVYESEELYDKLKEYQTITKRPIWAYMAHYGASGGYMVSLPANEIYANKNTVTGSIGVIMSGVDLTGLYEKLGIRYVSITSGRNKDSSQMTPEQIAIYQSQVDECYQSFVEKVSADRKLDMNTVLNLSDGRTYTAKQALSLQLIDHISTYDKMVEQMQQQYGIDLIYEPEDTTSIWESFLAHTYRILPKSESQVLNEIAHEKESGGLMYYAEQLR